MPFWEVYNGWRGNGQVRVLLEASTQAEAEAAALEAFRKEAATKIEYAERGVFGGPSRRKLDPERREYLESYACVVRVVRVDLPLLLEE